MEANAWRVEATLLQQACVVFTGQVLPFWVDEVRTWLARPSPWVLAPPAPVPGLAVVLPCVLRLPPRGIAFHNRTGRMCACLQATVVRLRVGTELER